MDEQNPAVSKHINIPPAVLEEVGKDPKAMEALCRKMYLVNADRMHRDMRSPNVAMSLRLQWLDHLAKYGGIGAARNQPAAAAPGTGFSVNIILDGSAPVSKPPTVVGVKNVYEELPEPAASSS